MYSGEILLHVNSDVRARNVLSAILKEHGLLVITASDSEEAIRCCQDIHIDIALLSYPIPGAYGKALPADIKFLRPEVPVIMISGDAAISQQDLAFVDAHLRADTPFEDLLGTIHRIVSHSYLHRTERPGATEWAEAT